jgi:rhodanese-related sulfurtransferase
MGRNMKFRGVQSTAICQVFDMTIASTGISEKTLKRFGESSQSIPYEKVCLHPGHHVRYYPDAMPMTIKLIFSSTDGKVLGAQAVGSEGVDKRIDVISMAIQRNSTVFDLEQCELCYAPQFGAAKDPVNIAGMIAANALRGDAPLSHWESADLDGSFILDVRQPGEFETDHVPKATNIPLGELRERLSEINCENQVLVYCEVGQRSYYASRLLRQHGIAAKNISGGFRCYNAWKQIHS